MRDDNDLNEDHLAEQPDEPSDEIKLSPRRSDEQPETFKRVALLVKGELLAVISLTRSPRANTVGCLDPRLRSTTVQSFSDPKRASATFHQAIRKSEERGWRVFYLGTPLLG
jgi:hypothetical protein